MQSDLRNAPLDQFPLASEFKAAEKQNTLIPVNDCAEFLADILLKTTHEQFSSRIWNIYEHFHKPMPQPLNKKKLAKEKKSEPSIVTVSHFSHPIQNENEELLRQYSSLRSKL